ncbi:CorA family divalent cation transporter [Nitrososphaera sp.]|uniref:magnesium transporter CorA family protein n=1 Tax=Nitrososphaera sp. TaxID=1971748 RepID=UPI00307EB6B1
MLASSKDGSSKYSSGSALTVMYNDSEVQILEGISGAKRGGYNVWVDLVDPSPEEARAVLGRFAVDPKAVEMYEHRSKRPQIRVFGDQTFTVMLSMGFENARTLSVDAVYFFMGHGWLVTIHSAHGDYAVEETRRLFEQKDSHMMASPVSSVFYSIITSIVNSYEQLLTSVELSITSLGQDSLHKTTKKTLDRLDILSKQIIILRRHFWHTRHVINIIINTDEGGEDDDGGNSSNNNGVHRLKVAYDEINQLIDLVESLRDSINSTRDLYVANISLHLNDTVRTLTIFASLLLPLTFISSVYGMNGLDLNNIWAFPAGLAVVLGTMAAIALVLFFYFKQRRWIMVKSEPGDDDDYYKGSNGKGGLKSRDKKQKPAPP